LREQRAVSRAPIEVEPIGSTLTGLEVDRALDRLLEICARVLRRGEGHFPSDRLACEVDCEIHIASQLQSRDALTQVQRVEELPVPVDRKLGDTAHLGPQKLEDPVDGGLAGHRILAERIEER